MKLEEIKRRGERISALLKVIEPIIHRALSFREQKQMSGEEEPYDFPLTEDELAKVKTYCNAVSQNDADPVMFLGMNLVRV